jgi:integrase
MARVLGSPSMGRRKGVFGSVYCRAHGKKCRGGLDSCRFYVRVRQGAQGRLRDFRKHIGNTRSIAEAKLASMRLSLETEGALGVAPIAKTTLEEFLPEYLPILKSRVSPVEAKKGEAKLRVAAAALQGPMVEVGRAEVTTFLRKLPAASGATRNRYQAALSMAWRAAFDRDIVRGNPWRGLPRAREAEKPTRWIAPEDLRRIELATPGPARPLVAVGAETGLRLSELLALTWRDVDLGRGVLTVRRSKSGRSRDVPLSMHAREVLEHLPRGGNTVFGGNFSSSWISHAFPDWATAAGQEGATFHDLRHAFCSGLARAGVPIPAIQALAGHATITVTMRYARHAPSDAGATAIAALEASRRPPVRTKGPRKGTGRRRRSSRKRRSPMKTGT